MLIYVSRNGGQWGPYSLEQLRCYIQQNTFRTNDLACYDGKNWILVSQVPGLFVSPPIPPPQSGAIEAPSTEEGEVSITFGEWFTFGFGCLGFIILGLVGFFSVVSDGIVKNNVFWMWAMFSFMAAFCVGRWRSCCIFFGLVWTVIVLVSVTEF